MKWTDDEDCHGAVMAVTRDNLARMAHLRLYLVADLQYAVDDALEPVGDLIEETVQGRRVPV